MSSAKSPARGIVAKKTAAKTASGRMTAPRPAAGGKAAKATGGAAAKAKVHAANGASAEAERLAGVLERAVGAGELDVVNAKALQKLLAAACRVYTARTEAGEQFMPVPRNTISATDVMVTASGLLRAVDLAAFELGMWQSWTGR